MKSFTGIMLALTAAAILSTPTPVEAKIYKCVAADGSTSYTQRPCATSEKTSKVLEGRSTREKFDCRVARSFSTHVAVQMKSGRTADDMFSEYGGLNAISPTSVSVINYVFSHKTNTDTSVNRISALSGARCESGSYSRNIECQDFPPSFITDMGGCSVVKGESSRQQEPNAQYARPTSDEDREEYQGASAAARNQNYNVLEESAADRQTACRESLNQKIRDIQTQMRGRLDVEAHNQLNAERNTLRDAYESC